MEKIESSAVEEVAKLHYRGDNVDVIIGKTAGAPRHGRIVCYAAQYDPATDMTTAFFTKAPQP